MIIQNCNKERLKDNADYTDDPSEVKAETLARVRMRIQEYLQLRDNNHKHNWQRNVYKGYMKCMYPRCLEWQ